MEQHTEALIHSSAHFGEVLTKISSALSSAEQRGPAGCSVSWHCPCLQSLGGAAAPVFLAPHPSMLCSTEFFVPNLRDKEDSGVQMWQELTR